MRISSSDKTFRPAKVWLDGRLLREVLEADEEAGTVVVALHDGEQRLCYEYSPSGPCVMTETLHGHVRVELIK